MLKIKTGLAVGAAALLFAGCAATSSGSASLVSSLPASLAPSVAASSSLSAPVVGSSSVQSAAANPGTSSWAIGPEQAAALFSASYPNMAITSIELEKSLGSYFYTVKGVDDNSEYELKVDAESGEAKNGLTEPLDAEEKNGVKKGQDALELGGLVPFDEIVEIAQTAAKKGTAVEFSLEKELGVHVWYVGVEDGALKIEVSINAQTGEVLQTEKD